MARSLAILYFLLIGAATLANAGAVTWVPQSSPSFVGSTGGSFTYDPDTDTYSNSSIQLPAQDYDTVGEALTPGSGDTPDEAGTDLLVVADSADVDLPDIAIGDLLAAASNSDNLTVGLDATTLINRVTGGAGRNATSGRVQNAAAISDTGKVGIMLGAMGLLIGGFMLFLGVSFRKLSGSRPPQAA